VHGYRCHDSRNNIGYCPDGDNIIYHTAAVGIIQKVEENNQGFVLENSDDIISFACYKDLCATGEIGPDPIIALWNNEEENGERAIYGNIAGVLTKGVLHMAFCNEGNKLAAIGMDEKHTIVVFDVK